MFYKRTRSCYTIRNPDCNANCFVWPETEGKGNVSELRTCLIDFDEEKSLSDVEDICHIVTIVQDRTIIFVLLLQL